jgi:thioredoxin
VRTALFLVLVILIVLMSGCPKPAPKEEPTAVSSPGAQTEQAPGTGTDGGKEIVWLTDLDQAVAEAKKQNKPVIVDFWATWCGPCKMMEESTWPDPKVIAASAGYIMVKQDVDKNQATADKYKVEGVPTLIFLSPDGKETHRQVGAVSAAELVQMMKTQGTAEAEKPAA